MSDVIVVGLGAMGSAAALRLARRGLSVTGIDRFSPPHTRGSTHGETRITRLAVGEGSEFVPLVRRSHELWREIERDAGTALMHQTGGLILGGRDNAFLARTREAAHEHAIVHENLSSEELRRRFPMFLTGPDTEAYFEPEAGFLHPEAAVAAQLSLARQSGAELRMGETVMGWSASASGVTVRTATETLDASELVLCPGPWIAELFPEGRKLFAIYPQLMHWFPIQRGYEALRAMPVFVWDTSERAKDFVHANAFYGFPALDGPDGGMKLATETYDAMVDPDRPPDAAAGEAALLLHECYLAQRFPWVAPGPLRSAWCLYTATRDTRFIIDRHPEHTNVMVISACSGHGFKHSAAIGEAVAQLIVDGTSEIDLTPFRMPSDLSGAAGEAQSTARREGP